jgi:DNA-binding CsgD family transcriptional regulator
MAADAQLRPIERRMRRLAHDGVPDGDIARRFRHSPEFVGRVLTLAELPARSAASRPTPALRPLERRVLRLRAEGTPHDEIAARLRRSPGFVRRVEELARYKLAR